MKGKCKICNKETIHFNKKTCSDGCESKLKVIKHNKKLLEKLGEEAYSKTVECVICGLRANDLISHITRTHKIKTEEYKEKYSKFTRSEEYLNDLSERIKGDKNPVHNLEDIQEISPFSYKFYMKKGYSEEEAKKIALDKSRETQKNISKESRTVNLEYWMKECNGNARMAIKLYKERQSTFSKKKCIQKYGKEEGLKRWKERQDKWQKTLDAKSDEEKERINYEKGNSVRYEFLEQKYGKEKALKIIKSRFSDKSYSKISQELFIEIYNKLENKDVYFATIKDGKIEDTGVNNEYMLLTHNNRHRFLDFYMPSKRKCIEFDGEFWHGGKPWDKKRDRIREEEIKETIEGINILHIKEMDYRNNPKETVHQCLEFLNE
jgi:hypothetical protein